MAASPERVSNIKNRYAVEAIRFSLWAAPGLILFLPWHGFRGFGPHGHGDIESLVGMPPPLDRISKIGESPWGIPRGCGMQAVTETWHLTLVPGKDGPRIRNEAKTTGRPNPADYFIGCRLPG